MATKTHKRLKKKMDMTVYSYEDTEGEGPRERSPNASQELLSFLRIFAANQLPITNGLVPVWMGLTDFGVRLSTVAASRESAANLAFSNSAAFSRSAATQRRQNGSNPDIVTTNIGNVFVPKTAEGFSYEKAGVREGGVKTEILE